MMLKLIVVVLEENCIEILRKLFILHCFFIRLDGILFRFDGFFNIVRCFLVIFELVKLVNNILSSKLLIVLELVWNTVVISLRPLTHLLAMVI